MAKAKLADAGEWSEEEEGFVALDIPREFLTLPFKEEPMTVRDLWARIISGELELEPDFQRHYVWDDVRASRFIESLLLNLPVPPLFLAERPDGTLEVIDGHQRLETLFRYMQPLLPGPSRQARVKPLIPRTSLTLKGCEVLSELNGRDITALPRGESPTEGEPQETAGEPSDKITRKGLWDRPMQVITVLKDAHHAMKFELFQRLNQGSMALNPQELRNCLYRGPYSNLIKRLVESPEILKVFGQRESDKRMADRERVLRFFALAHRSDRLRSPFRSFLDDEMKANQHASPAALPSFQQEFQEALSWSQRVFQPEQLFRLFRLGTQANPNGHWDRKRVELVYELEMVGFYQFRDALDRLWQGPLAAQRAQRDNFVISLRRSLIDVMVKADFLETMQGGTKMPHVVRRRFDFWSDALRRAVQNWERLIEGVDKVVALQRRSTACGLCPQRIGAVEDAVVINAGGQEALAHRFCSSERTAGAI